MKASEFAGTQIVSILRRADAGLPVEDICRQAGSACRRTAGENRITGRVEWGRKRVKELEAENNELKRMYVRLALDDVALKDLIAKNGRVEQ